MKRTVWICILMTALCVPSFAECPDAEKKRLEELDRAWAEATRRGDRAALQEIFADDYMSLSLTGPRTKSETIDNAVLAAERQRSSTEPAPTNVYDMYRITCTPTTAVITHRATTTSREGQTSFFRSLHVLEKRGGKWQVVSNAGHASTDTEILAEMEYEWAQAHARKDLEWYERNLANDFSGINSRTGAVRNKSEAIADLRNLKDRVESVELSELSIRIAGDTGVGTGVYRVIGRDEQGKAMDRRFRFTDVFVKRAGRWQAWSTQSTSIQP